MDFVSCDYIFASTSTTTLEETARIKETFPGINTCLIDATTQQPDIAPNCQIAIVTLDFSNLSEALSALEYARASLTVGGLLLSSDSILHAGSTLFLVDNSSIGLLRKVARGYRISILHSSGNCNCSNLTFPMQSPLNYPQTPSLALIC